MASLYGAGAQSDHLAGSVVFSYDNIWKLCSHLYRNGRLYITYRCSLFPIVYDVSGFVVCCPALYRTFHKPALPVHPFSASPIFLSAWTASAYGYQRKHAAESTHSKAGYIQAVAFWILWGSMKAFIRIIWKWHRQTETGNPMPFFLYEASTAAFQADIKEEISPVCL